MMIVRPNLIGAVGLRAVAEAGYTPNAVDFDGTNDYLTRGAGLDGVSDSKLLSFGGWVNTDVDDTTQRIVTGVTTVGGSTLRFWAQIGTAESLEITARNASGTNILVVSCANGLLQAGDGWVNFLFSCDLSDTGKRNLRINDAASLNVSTYTNDSIDFTLGDWAVGAIADGTNKLNGQLCDLWFAPGAYIDFSVESNRRHFVTAAGGHPGTSPASGLTTLGVTPAILLLGDAAGFGTNSGNGGDFTITGSLDDVTPPS